MKKNTLLRVEFHCHTVCSMDSSNKLAQLLKLAPERGIDRLAITDHNTIRGALKAKEMAPELVIIGEEVMTTRGELLASCELTHKDRVMAETEALARLHEQGAFISVPHPFDLMRHGWQMHDLQEILPQVDAVEVFNARCWKRGVNELAEAFAAEHDMPGTVGSDAHSYIGLGLATMLLPHFTTADELRGVIRQGKAQKHMLSPLDHLKANASIAMGKLLLWNWKKRR